MTLDELANLNDANDEEVDEESAFNSDDEKEFGKYFEKRVRSKNLSLSIPLEDDTVRTVEIPRGGKMTLSSVCLDLFKSLCKL